MKPALFLIVFVPFFLRAQNEKGIPQSKDEIGVHFEHNLSWAAVQAKAKAENKYIFMDCFTTWCGPCRFMSTTIFPKEETGAYFNDKFVSVKVQLDSTANDADNIKAWYQDGHDIAEKYGVRAYPTYLIFAPDGQVVHRMVGSRLDSKSFIADVSESFDSSKQYYTLMGQYDKGRRDTAFLHKLAMSCFSAYDLTNGKAVAMDWLGTQSDLLSRDALYLQDAFTKKSTDKYFPTFTDHAADVDKLFGPGFAEAKVRNVFLVEATAGDAGDNRPPDWAAIHAKIAAKLPADADELTARVKVTWYLTKKDYPGFEKAIVAYMNAYSSKMSDMELNNIAWSVFQGCSDMTCVSEVLDWSKRLKDNKEPGFMDTYANILYKLGKKDDAIALEAKAISLSPDADKASLQETLDKMKKGEKTW